MTTMARVSLMVSLYSALSAHQASCCTAAQSRPSVLVRRVHSVPRANGRAANGLSPLFDALIRGDLNAAEALAKNGADVNECSREGLTPLQWAVYENEVSAARLLLSYGADVGLAQCNGMSPLHMVSQQTTSKVLKLVISKGARVNEKATGGVTPLHMAASHANAGAVQLLLRTGAQARAGYDGGGNALHALLSADPPEAAASTIVDMLLSRGADVNARDRDRNTPLHYAALLGYYRLTERLLNAGSEVNTKNSARSTPLLVAIHWQNRRVACLLLSRGAFLELNTAAALGRLGVVEAALRKGAAINGKDEFGCTALDYALRYHRSQVAELLASRGARRGDSCCSGS